MQIDWSSHFALILTYQRVDTHLVPKLVHTGANQIELLVFRCVQLHAAVILQLTKAECPRLQMLILSYDRLNGAAMYLAQGKRPLLETFGSEGRNP